MHADFLENLVLYFKHLTFRQLCGELSLCQYLGRPAFFTAWLQELWEKDILNMGTLHPSGHTQHRHLSSIQRNQQILHHLKNLSPIQKSSNK